MDSLKVKRKKKKTYTSEVVLSGESAVNFLQTSNEICGAQTENCKTGN